MTRSSIITNSREKYLSSYERYVIQGGFGESRDYYVNERERYWRCLQLFSDLDLPVPARILEIGFGQMAVLCKDIFGDDCTVGDIRQEFAKPVEKVGIPFKIVDLYERDRTQLNDQFDVIFLLEVIEHLPVPGYIVLEYLKRFLRSGGVLFLTTPNLFRLRNLVRMTRGVDFLSKFTYPTPGQGLGHQLEYSASHLRWQAERAGYKIISVSLDGLGHKGHSPSARFLRLLASPFERIVPWWRDGLVGVFQNP